MYLKLSDKIIDNIDEFKKDDIQFNIFIDTNMYYENNILNLQFNETVFYKYKKDISIDEFFLNINFIINNDKITYQTSKYLCNENNDYVIDDNTLIDYHKNIIQCSKKVINYSYNDFIKTVKTLYNIYEQQPNIENNMIVEIENKFINYSYEEFINEFKIK